MNELIGDRFEVLRTLGSGGLSDVSLVRDRRDGSTRALKRLRLTDSESLERLRSEFSELAAIRHPNIVRVHEYGTTEGGAWISMDAIEGRPADLAIRPGDITGALRLAVDSIAGSDALHAAGRFHGDINPSNILVGTGGAVLIDFGFMGRQNEMPGGRRRGTPGYLAPEVLSGEAPYGSASDAYALGATLFRVLTGRPAFPGRDTAAILSTQARGMPSIQKLESAGVPRVLSDLVLELMSERPEARIVAMAALRDLAQRRLGSVASDKERATLATSGPLIGRAEEMASIRALLLTSARGCRFAVLAGPTGCGRTRLAHEIAIEAELAGWTVEWHDARSLPDSSSSKLTHGDKGRLVVFDDVDEWPEHALGAYRLDGDGGSPVAVLAVTRSPRLDGHSFLRWSMTVSESSAPRVFELRALDTEGCTALVRSRLGGALPSAFLESVFRESAGSPARITAIVVRLVESGALRREGEGWTFPLGQSIDAIVRGAASRDQSAEFQSLGEDARQVLVAIAADDLSVGDQRLVDWTGLSSEAVAGALEEIDWRGILAREQQRLRVVPRSLEREVLEDLEGRGVEQVRARIVTAFESIEPRPNARNLRRIGSLYWSLGQAERAIEAWRKAWDLLHKADPDEVLEFSQLFETRALPPRADAAFLLSSLAEHWQIKRPALSETLWGRAAATMPGDSPIDFLAHCAIQRARALYMLARYAEGLDALASLFDREDHRSLSRIRRGEALIERGWGRAMLGRASEARADWTESLQILPEDAIAERTVANHRFASFSIQWGEFDEARSRLDKALELATQSRDSGLESRVLANKSQLASNLGRFDEAREGYQRAVALSRKVPDAFWLPVQLTNLLTLQAQLGDWEAWRGTAEETMTLSRTIGDVALLCAVLEARESVYVRRADLAEALRALRSDRDWLAHSRRPDQHAHHRIMKGMIAGLLGREGSAKSILTSAYVEAINARHPLSAAQSSAALGDLMLRRNRTQQATRWYQRTLKSGVKAQNMAVFARLGLLRIALRQANISKARSLEHQLESDVEHAPPLEKQAIHAEVRASNGLLDRNAGAAAKEYRESISALESRGLILRAIETAWEAARAMLALDDRQASDAFLLDAWRLVKGTRVEAWKSRIATELVSRGVGAAQPAEDGDSPEVRSFLARVAELMNSLLDYPTLIQKSLELVARHLEAERGYILLVAPDTGEIRTVGEFGAVTEESQESALSYSRSIVRRVAASGEAFRVDDAATDPRLGSTQSVLDLAVRSVLCTPLRIREELIGTVYLESRSSAAQFTENDLELLDAYANLVAIAIDNSRKYDALRRSRERIIHTNLSLRNDVTTRYQPANIVGRSAEIERVLDEIELIANSKGTVLITGESGTGKDLIAKTIHYNSPRRDQPFLSLNCAAMPTDLIEAELFGVEDQAATGVRGRPGIFERADRGTLFLDEIGDMPTSLQAKLLRVLQEREFERVGSVGRIIRVDVRLVAATNKDLPQLIHEGQFREDLYFRLHALPIHIAPLRERKADILPLAEHFLKRFCDENGRPTPTLSPEFKAMLHKHTWRGNVRELQHYIERAVVMSPGASLRPIPFGSDLGSLAPVASPVPQSSADLKSGETLKDAIETFEARVIRKALESASWNQRRAAQVLGLKEATLRYKISRLAISPASAGRKKS